jgi:hypothetical protein
MTDQHEKVIPEQAAVVASKRAITCHIRCMGRKNDARAGHTALPNRWADSSMQTVSPPCIFNVCLPKKKIPCMQGEATLHQLADAEWLRLECLLVGH